MSFKDILVYLDPTPASAARLSMALQIAFVDGAFVTGIDASTDEALTGEAHDLATGVESAFHAALRAEGVAGAFQIARSGKPTQSFALPADLVIAPSPSIEHRKLIHADLPDEVVKQSSAPVLVVPTDWRGGAWGNNVVVAWNGGRAASRAVRDALPILKRAASVSVFVFSRPDSELRAATPLMIDYLGRHGVAARLSEWTSDGDVAAIEALFASHDMQAADLLVAGASSQAGLFESLFGGASFDLLRQPVLPVLMSN